MDADIINEDIANLLTDTNDISDGYHTFGELYEHRFALFIALIKCYPKLSWRANNNDDGEGYAGWFVAGIHLPTGDISYHLPVDRWKDLDNLGLPTTNCAPKWDGHTSLDVINRLNNL
jgi:hypothetical protein